jgi:hypothetical protein
MTPLRQRMVEDMQVRNLSSNTQRAYIDLAGRRRTWARRKFAPTSRIWSMSENSHPARTKSRSARCFLETWATLEI